MFANNSQTVGEAEQVIGTTWPLPPIPIVIEPQNTSVRILIPLNNIYEPLENLSLIVSNTWDINYSNRTYTVLCHNTVYNMG